MSRPLITLTTDFGGSDSYAGTMKGVILGICPEATLVDLSHEVPAHEVLAASVVLWQAAPEFPEFFLDVRGLYSLLPRLGKLTGDGCLVRRFRTGTGQCFFPYWPEEPPEQRDRQPEDQQHQAGVDRFHPGRQCLQLLPELEQATKRERQQEHCQQGKKQ